MRSPASLNPFKRTRTDEEVSRRRVTNWSKTLFRTAIVDPATGRPMSRFKRRRLEQSPAGRAQLRTAERERRQMLEASAVTKDAKRRLKDAAEGR